MTDHAPLKYECLERFKEIISQCKDDDASKLMIEMFDLIIYQMDQIKQQRLEIVAMKHKTAWKQYDAKPCAIDNTKKCGKKCC